MNDLPIDDSILEDWLGGPVPEEKLKEIRESSLLSNLYIRIYHFIYD